MTISVRQDKQGQVRNIYELPPDLPRPIDDGGTAHLLGHKIPDLTLESTIGPLNLSSIFKKPAILFIYPRAGSPLEPNANQELWDQTAGARGCTPQSCSFRDKHERFQSLGVAVYGLSVQPPHVQAEFAQRNNIRFPVLSDSQQQLSKALNLPTFIFEGESLIKRMAIVVDKNVIRKVFYPVFPPDQNATEVLDWIESDWSTRA